MLLQSLSGKWQFRNLTGPDWYSGLVPGSVQLDLLSLEKIPDPFLADNELQVQWVAQADWEYRLKFTPTPGLLSQERQFLVFEGLDTLAEVALNEQALGKAENMFRRYSWEVTGRLRPGLNSLSVTFRSPVAYTAERQSAFPLAGVQQALPGASYLRKAPCQFGWDWGPQLPAIGIWREVRLEAYSTARLEDVHLRQQHRDGMVKLVAQISIEKWARAEISAQAEISTRLLATGPNGEVFETSAGFSDDTAGLELEIENPELWYPNGYGPQPLYQVEVTLMQGDQLLDRRDFQIGLRTLELRQEPDEWGQSFTFVVNGRPIFAKGANWIPADSFPTRISEQQLDSLLRAAADSHQNMLRVWGGGYYEDEKFYDLCDRYGLLVWQDFIFSCSVYPLDDPAFVENVRVEAVQNIGRLRHRACLALWCGNNEMEEGWVYWGWNVPQYAGLKEAYEKFFFHTLPAWVKDEDPDTPYWPSSPSSGKPFQGAHEPKGDLHYWEVWHGRKPFSAYRKVYPRFMSEFGFQALPTFEMIAEFAPPEEWNMTSYLMDHHQRSPGGNGLIIAQMAEQFRMPKDFASLVYLSQTLQAEGIRYGVEHWRRNKPRVAGALYWQLNDCWPAVSWSSLDYSGSWKALHYAARRFFAPLLLSLVDEGRDIQIHLTSDLDQAWEGLLRWSLASLDGEILSVEERQVRLEPDETRLVETLHLEPPQERLRELILIAEIYEGDRRSAMQIATLVPSKHLKLSDPGLETALSLEDGLLQIKITAGSLARFVEVGLEGAQVVFSDNFFDLPAGYTATLSAPLPPGWNLEQARDKLRLRSLYDTYQAG